MSYERIVHDTLLDNYGVFLFNDSKTGNAYADFLLGLPATMTQDAPVRKLDNGAYISLFAQDDFRVHPRVTLNLGVRYDLQFPLTDPLNRKLAFVPGARSQVSPTALEGLLFPGDPGISRGIVKTDINNIAPRLGIAWDPRGDGRMAVRAGAGIFYGSITGNEWNTTADNQPFTVRQSFPTVSTLSDPYGNLPGGVAPFPFDYDPASPRFTLPAQVFGPSLDFVWPYTYQMNVTIEKEIFRSFSTSASYVGALGRKLPGEHRPELPGLRTGGDHGQRQRAAAVPARRHRRRRACSNRSSTATTTPCSSAPSGAARAFRPRRITRSARRMEDVDYQGGGLPAVQNSNRIDLERGRTSADRTHSFTFSGVWKIDYLENSSAVAKALLNDWTVSTIVTLQSGTPLTITSGQDRNFDGLTNDRADIIGDPNSRFRPSARGADRAVVQHGGVRAAGDRPRRHGRPQHRRRSGVSQRRSRGLPRRSPARPHGLSVPAGSDQRAQHRQPAESGHEPQRAGPVRKDPFGPRHAEDSARRAILF